ncbi:MAG: PA14 domain-containing protein [Kiritimatiellaeota bacterium]|nr:PA14 domain-containing protein [Kiritimatiellota bacterium]
MNMTTWKTRMGCGLAALMLSGGLMGLGISPAWGAEAGTAAASRVSGWKPAAGPLMTRWANDVSPHRAWSEYPRPQMVRGKWTSLNGLWDCAIRPKDADGGEVRRSLGEGGDGKILVPFAVESALSGVMKPLKPEQRLWYRRTFAKPELPADHRLLLHFQAVDWRCEVWVNDRKAGEHTGGYDPFTFDITEALKEGENELVVAVIDPTNAGWQPRGKQVLSPSGCSYTAVSGIWQTPWLEPVPANHIRSLKIVPDIDGKCAIVTVETTTAADVKLTALDGGSVVATAKGRSGETLHLKIGNPMLWSPDNPFLYDLAVTLTESDRTRDDVKSYFGMRKIEVRKDKNGINRLFLNNQALFHYGPLDQGWWPDGLHTAPTDEALKYDIEMMKTLGFNMARKHVKYEPERWYYWCDKLGLLVWQDMPSGNAGNEESKPNFRRELKAMMDTLHNHPSIVMWVLFSEGWGQHDTVELVKWMESYDPTRPVNEASGWQDKGSGKISDKHEYTGPSMRSLEDKRAVVLGEFGGLSLLVPDHSWQTNSVTFWRDCKDSRQLTGGYVHLLTALQPMIERGLAAAVYTQLTDIETEINGFLTYDREVVKMDLASLVEAADRSKGTPAPRKASLLDIFIDTGEVALEAPADKARIAYTLDGSDPAVHSQVYRKPIGVSRDTVVKARSIWPDGRMSSVASFPMKKVTPLAAVASGQTQPGLNVNVYELAEVMPKLPDFTKLKPSKTAVAERVNLKPKTRGERYGLLFDGFLNAPVTGIYVIRVTSDDGAEVLLHGKPLCGEDGIHGDRESAGTVALQAGAHPLRIRYFQGVGGESLRLEWAVPDGQMEEIPAQAFCHTPAP